MPSRYRAHGRVFIRWISSCFNPSSHGGGAVISAPMKAAGDKAAVLRHQSNQQSASSSSLGRIALGDSECCAICLGELIGCAGVKVLPRCGHEFHEECIDEWLPSRSLNCPVCREQAGDDDHQKKLIRKPVANGTLHHDPAAQAFAINFSSVYLGCFVSVN